MKNDDCLRSDHFLPFSQPENKVQRMGSVSEVDFPASVNLIKMIPYRLCQWLVS